MGCSSSSAYKQHKQVKQNSKGNRRPGDKNSPRANGERRDSLESNESAGITATKSFNRREEEAARILAAALQQNSAENAVRRKLIWDNRANIEAYYTLEEKKLGQGAFGYVVKGTSKETSAVRAVKSLSKARSSDTRKRYRQEIVIMKMTDHPNIIKLFETFEDSKRIYLVMELCTGGSLHDRVLSQGTFSEVQSATVMQQILRPLRYMHSKRIAHRDMKPENFLFLTKDKIEDNTMKLIDFGFSCVIADGQPMTTKLGTVRYSSPQVLAGQYDESCDLWSCGVILYVVLSGGPPFTGRTDSEVMTAVKKGNYAFRGGPWTKISEGAKDLIRQLLKYNQEDRHTAEQALQHSWIQAMIPEAGTLVKERDAKPISSLFSLPSLFLDLRSFFVQNRLRRAALHIVAQQLSEEETKFLRKAFMALDTRGCGVLFVKELQASLTEDERKSLPPELWQVMGELSAGGGSIGYTDFLAASLEAKHYLKDGACRAAFRFFDRNGDGWIDEKELTVLVDEETEGHLLRDVVARLLDQVDKNGDGVIDFEEFIALMRGNNSSYV